jgi:hypothetical protein
MQKEGFMDFLPIGPDFVFAPRDTNFKRLSSRNEDGRQGLISQVAVDSNDPNNIFTVIRPSSGGASVFRSDDGGGSWTSLFDTLLQADPVSAQATALAINPSNSSFVYVGTDAGVVFLSSDRGRTWTRSNVSGDVRQILVDPRTASNPVTTGLLAATGQGIFRSTTGGMNWSQVFAGNVTAIAASFPKSGSDDFYASVWQTGLFYAKDPGGPWTNLNAQNIGLPPRDNNNNFDAFGIALCHAIPHRAYIWMARSSKTLGIFSSVSPAEAWTPVAAVAPPDPGQGLYSFGVAVTPGSPGDGQKDVLFFIGTHLSRSIDGGRTWANAFGNALHDDQHCIAFAPDPAPAGVIPGMYIGCDGGLGFSDQFPDPAFAFSAAADLDQGDTYTDSGAIQNYNHGVQGNAIIVYDSVPSVAALSYIACQDTCIAGGHVD